MVVPIQQAVCIRASHFDDEKSVKVRYWKAKSDRGLEYKEFVPIVGPEVGLSAADTPKAPPVIRSSSLAFWWGCFDMQASTETDNSMRAD